MIMPFEGTEPQMGEGVFIAPSADIIGDVCIGAHSSIWFGCVVRGDVNSIKIGQNTNIQDLSMVHVTHFTQEDKRDGFTTVIGDNVTIGHRVMLHGCVIEDACLIGMSSTILDGAVIGKESIVGAHSLITKHKIFPPRSLIMGNPAKWVRELTDAEVASLYMSASNYVSFKTKYL